MLMLIVLYALQCAFIALGYWSGAYRSRTWLFAMLAWQLALQLVAGSVSRSGAAQFMVAILSMAAIIVINAIMRRYGLLHEQKTDKS